MADDFSDLDDAELLVALTYTGGPRSVAETVEPLDVVGLSSAPQAQDDIVVESNRCSRGDLDVPPSIPSLGDFGFNEASMTLLAHAGAPRVTTSTTASTRPLESKSRLAVDLEHVEEHSLLSIKNRRVPADDLRRALMGRTRHTIRTLSEGPRARFLDGDASCASSDAAATWVTIGVLSEKKAPKSSVKSQGNYVMWTLTDYKATVNVMLFGDAYKAHWKEVRDADGESL